MKKLALVLVLLAGSLPAMATEFSLSDGETGPIVVSMQIHVRNEKEELTAYPKQIAEFTGLPVSRALDAARAIKLNPREQLIAGRILREVAERLQFLNNVGLGYISLERSAATLSGGRNGSRAHATAAL